MAPVIVLVEVFWETRLEGNQKANGVSRWVGLAEAKVNAFSVLVVEDLSHHSVSPEE
jgi:hypothetical protein